MPLRLAFVPLPEIPPWVLSCPGVADIDGAGRALSDDPGGAVTGVAAPAPAVGSALSEATGLPDDEVEIPAPGEIWLEALSSVEVLVALWLSSMSLSSATTSLELP